MENGCVFVLQPVQPVPRAAFSPRCLRPPTTFITVHHRGVMSGLPGRGREQEAGCGTGVMCRAQVRILLHFLEVFLINN